MWRCVNDNRGYCSGEPEWETEPQQYSLKKEGEDVATFQASGVCKLTPNTCGKFYHKTPTEQPSNPKGSYKHKVVPKKEKEKEVKGKPVQARMFE